MNTLKRTYTRVTTAVRRRPDPLTSLVLTIPVYLVYHLGILFVDMRNGVDLVSNLTLELLHASVSGYIAVTLGVAAGLMVAVWFMRRHGKVKPAALMPVLIESTLWALVMLASVGWATQRVVASLSLGPAMGVMDKLVMAAGAGFHEEIIFRVVLVSGTVLALTRWTKLGQVRAVIIAALCSAALFALVHHLGPLGDPLSVTLLTFRTLAGLFLTGVYLLRGFAVVVYTHTIYDVLIFFVLS